MLVAKTKPANDDGRYESWAFYPREINAVWPELEPLVTSALKQSRGELAADDVLRYLREGTFTAFVTVQDGRIELVMIMEIVTFPRMTKANIVVVAGKGVWKAERFLPAVEQWALAHGAVELTGYVRPEKRNTRLYRRSGLQVGYYVMCKDLRRKLQ